ncbi:helix-turn-helix domain-containing protein [Proteus faecis]|uniref:helix-turn-helix domain-containing protein n=1 Tax=Proteus faecis TaxID=2050967 RepID=UPI0020C0BAB0
MKETSIDISLGGYLRASRKLKGMTGKELGEKVSLSQQQISRYERGINKFTLDMFIKIVKALDSKPCDATRVVNQVLKKEFDI